MPVAFSKISQNIAIPNSSTNSMEASAEVRGHNNPAMSSRSARRAYAQIEH